MLNSALEYSWENCIQLHLIDEGTETQSARLISQGIFNNLFY